MIAVTVCVILRLFSKKGLNMKSETEEICEIKDEVVVLERYQIGLGKFNDEETSLENIPHSRQSSVIQNEVLFTVLKERSMNYCQQALEFPNQQSLPTQHKI